MRTMQRSQETLTILTASYFSSIAAAFFNVNFDHSEVIIELYDRIVYNKGIQCAISSILAFSARSVLSFVSIFTLSAIEGFFFQGSIPDLLEIAGIYTIDYMLIVIALCMFFVLVYWMLTRIFSVAS